MAQAALFSSEIGSVLGSSSGRTSGPGGSFAMILVTLEAPKTKTLDMDRLIAEILREFEGARITALNSFEAELQKKQELMSQLEREGHPIRNPEMIFAVIRNKEAALGPARDIDIPVGPGHSLVGRVSTHDVILRSECSIPNPEVGRLVELLKSLRVGDVNVREM
jgi:hypothetical protein